MPQFFFHQRIGDDLIEDTEGFEYADIAAARASAVISARSLWAAAIRGGDDLSGETIEIVDTCGRPVAEVPLYEGLPFSLTASLRRT